MNAIQQFRSWAVAAAVAMGLSLATGCETSPDPVSEPRPKLGELEPARTHPILPATALPPRAPVTMVLTRLDFAEDADLDTAWTATTTQGLSNGAAAMWLANGLRVGILAAHEVPTFNKALPAPVTSMQRRLMTAAEYEPLSLAPPLTGPVKLKLTARGDAVKEETFTRGRFQFLLRQVGAAGSPVLELTPHLYLPKASIVIRPMAQRELDGRIFDELTIAAGMAPGQVLVIGVAQEVTVTPPGLFDNPPTPPGTPPTTPPGTQPATATQPAPSPERPPVSVRSLPRDRLGTFLLANYRHRRLVQTLLIISPG